MRYYLDTEFLEGTQKSFFGKTKPTIDLISIGIVSEDGKEYYAISKDFNLKEAWNRYDIEIQSGDMRNIFPEGRRVYWIRENVLKPIFDEFLSPIQDSIDNNYRKFTLRNFKFLLNKYGKSNKKIAEEVYDFCITYDITKSVKDNNPEFYTYYGDYDWVVFCWLFGKMIDLPKGFPMYSKDLKQILDEKQNDLIITTGYKMRAGRPNLGIWHSDLKNDKNYPKNPDEHNALADAHWNRALHTFLENLE